MCAMLCLRRAMLIASCILVFALIDGCAARQAQTAPQPGLGIALPVLPSPGALARSVSEAVLLRLGSEYDPACAQNLSAAGDNAVFAPAWADNTSPASSLAYGLYRLNLAGYAGAAEVHCVWSGAQPAAGTAYVGLSNWIYNRWDWFGVPDNGVVSLPGAGFAPYINGGVGETLVIVMCLGQEEHVMQAMGAQAPPPLDNWPMYQHDAQHTGRSTHIGPATNTLKWKFEDLTGPGGKLSSPAVGPEGQVYAGGYYDLYAFNSDGSFAWKAPAGDCSRWAPLVASDGTLYTASSEGQLYAFNPDGTQQWVYALSGQLQQPPLFAVDGTVMFVDGGLVNALNPDGTLKWTFQHPLGYSFINTLACGSNGVAYIALGNDMFAIDSDGTLRWSFYDAELFSNLPPAIDADGTAYFGDSKLFALNADGTLKWKTDGAIAFYQRAVSAEHKLYAIGRPIASSNYYLYALDETGVIQWQLDVDDKISTTPMINIDGAIIYGEGRDEAYVPELHSLHAVSPAGVALWSTQVHGAVLPQLTHDAAGTIYCTGELFAGLAYEHNRVYALSSAGAVLWASGTGGVPSGTAVVGVDGRVYAGFDDGNVYALQPDGTLSWKYETDGRPSGSSPAVADDGTVYVPSTDGRMIAISDGGTLAWEYAESYSIMVSSPTIGPDGAIYYGDYGDTTQPIGQNGVMSALNPDGSLLWNTTLDATIYTSISITPENTRYVASAYGDLRAYDPSGVEQWQFDLEPAAPQHSSVAVAADGTLYTAGPGNSLIALNPVGTTQWSYPVSGNVFSTPALGADGKVFIGAMDRQLYALNPDGTLAWQYPAGGAIYGSPAVDGAGRVYFGSWDGSVYALNPDGTLAWSYATGGEIWGSPSIGLDGTVYVGSNDGGLYAFGPGEG